MAGNRRTDELNSFRPLVRALRWGTLAVVAVGALTLALLITGSLGSTDGGKSLQWSIWFLLVALMAGHAHRLLAQAERRTSIALDRAAGLAEANGLLSAVYRVTEALPSPLDLDEVIEAAITRLRDFVDFEAAAVLVRQDSGGSWTLAGVEGLQEGSSLPDAELPSPLAAAARSPVAVVFDELTTQAPGLAPRARSGLYCTLRARGAPVGLLVLEHSAPKHFRRQDLEFVDGIAGPAALAIDNARWFFRLRTLGAEEERTRIARDLHDRIGQSLAYLAFELDRLARRPELVPARHELHTLGGDVRQVIGEVRETLFDLRTDVSERQSLVSTFELYLDRVRRRCQLDIDFEHEASGRLPLPQERELWRIAQEAIANVERHAHASHLWVRWQCDGKQALLEVIDDGRGFAVESTPKTGSYGLLGMRERAEAMGARLEIVSLVPGGGTTVRCTVEAA